MPAGKHEKTENTVNKVNLLLKEGLKLNIKVLSAERKESKFPQRPGLIIINCKNYDDKQLILKSKAKLSDSTNYEKVYIEQGKKTRNN